MTKRRLDASRILKRMSKVRELRAAAALACATREELARRHALDGAATACDTVAAASSACLEAGRQVDTARYDLLVRMGDALAQQRERASLDFQQAAERRWASAADGVRAQRHYEQIDERVASLERTRRHAQAARVDEDALDLWLKHREQP